ncbi:MAG: beta-propeller domain-containing protein, partial [Candidatus Peregrinibacteria bacterium]
EWFASYVCAAKEEGIVGGYPDGRFKPGQTINFVEAGKILSLAYGQQVESSGQWYEGYARALESSKAIPSSVAGLEKPVTRGEMAEMMWRLSEGITDQPSKGYLNVKYPSLAVNLSSEQPQTAKSCGDLAAFAEESQQTGTWRNRGMMIEMTAPTGVMAPQAARADGTAGGGGTGDYSQTNVQVEGVDEADIVKTDGTYLYAVQDDIIRIIRAVPASAMQVVSMIDLNDSSFSPSELYLDGDRLVVTGSMWKKQPYSIMQKIAPSIYPYPYGRQRTQVRLYDVSDRSNPKLSRELSFDGSLVSSRRIGDSMYLVMNHGFTWVGPMPLYREENVLPSYTDSAKGENDLPVAKCSDVTILPHVLEPEYLIVAVVPLTSATAEVKKEVVVGSAQNLYVSTDNLFVAATEWSYFWREGTGSSEEQTHLYRFALTDHGVSFKAKGTVPGHILNQFSMDEHEQSFRVATTQGQSWDSEHPSSSNLFVLNFDLEQVGSVTGIAPGEQIYSVRFLGDRTYMVTFKKTDPFFVFDTSDPRNPKILGKLKIPGYSDYLHPYDENHILGFGKEAVDSKEGNFAWYQGMKVALFDVTDPNNPKEMSKVTIGDRGTQSPLLYNHKALLFDRERHLLVFPVSVARIPDAEKARGSWDSPAYGDTVFQGAYVYNVDLQGGLTLRGTITHYGADDILKSGSYLYGKDIERIVRIGDALLSVGQDRVVSSVEQTLVPEGHVLYE